MSKILEGLNKNQQLAVKYSGGPLRIIAGAGSGKTRVLTHKIAYLIKEVGVPASKILAVTFTNKAAAEMRERVANIVGSEAKKSILSTYHSMCVRILRQEIKTLGYPITFNIIDNIDQRQILRPIYKKYDLSSKTMPYSHMISYISNAKINLRTPEQLIEESQREGEKFQALIYKGYVEALFKNKSLDFDDLLIFVYNIFKTKKTILKKWQDKFDYILVDEFQDTSWVQYGIIKMLNRTNNLTIVGDPDQTIYTWRGAKVQLIINFNQDFKKTKTINLEENYRSTKEILKVANNLIHYNHNRLEKDLFTNNEDGKKIDFHHAFSPEAEAKWVVKKIKDLRSEKVVLNKITIFYRSNYLSKTMEQALIAANISYKIYGDVKFFERQEIKDSIAFLKVIFNGDEIGMQRIINVPARKIGATSIAKLTKLSNEKEQKLFEYIMNNFDFLPISISQKEQLAKLFNLFKKYRIALKTNPISLVLEKFLIEVGYYSSLKSFNESVRIENIKELIRSVQLWEKRNPKKTISDYLEEIALVSTQDEMGGLSSSVALMTIHTSKGLEFENVFIIGLSEGVFPSSKAIASGPASIEEERRLAYVAITRAKERLFLSDSKGYSIDHRFMKIPSRFLREMGLRLKDFTPNIVIPTSFNENYERQNRNFKIGTKVKHKIFGEGVIVKAKGTTITIGFADPHGEKTLMKNHKSIREV